MKHTLQYFKNRIGKRIYRLTKAKCCKTCDKVEEEGLTIMNKEHAEYIYTMQNELGLEYGEIKI